MYNVVIKALIVFKIFPNPQETLIADYISSLIRNVSSSDHSITHGVAVIRLDQEPESSIYFEVLGKILHQNSNNPVYAHSLMKTLPPYDVHASSFFVLIADTLNLVGIQNFGKKNLKFFF